MNGKILKVTLEQFERAAVICMAANIPFAVWGGVGIGKTATVKRLSRNTNRKLYLTRISDKLPQDLGGTPMPIVPLDKDGNQIVAEGYLKYLMATGQMPFITPSRPDENCLLFIDEIDRTENPDTQNTAMQYLDGEDVNGNRLVPGCRLGVAGNGGTDQYTAPLSEAFRRRVVHFYVETDSVAAQESYQSWALENDIEPLTRMFAQEKWAIFTDSGNTERIREVADLAVISPDSFTKVDRLLRIATDPNCPVKTSDIIPHLVQGCIGHAAAVEFLDFRKTFGHVPTITEILHDPEHTYVPDPDKDPNAQGIFYPLTMSLVEHATRDRATAEAVATYGLRWPEEPQALLMRKLIDKYPQIATSPTYQIWSNKRTKRTSGAGTQYTNHLPALAGIFLHSKPLPENDGWVNRLQIPSESDPTKHYIISQELGKPEWKCSCRSWTTRRTCKHVMRIPDSMQVV